MTFYRKGLGSRGEEEAVAYLSGLGYQIMTRNYRCRLGELDIIAKDQQGVLVFVEVRSRAGHSHGLPEESINYRKQNKLRMLAQQYLLTHPKLKEAPCRFDVVAVEFTPNGEKKDIRHIKNAF
ncbi:YraN family protein [Desulforamulus ferrireducens]|uniref:YraN family protein n=1 Tax=Desulforamulus ferrireducens TaxID=1833852 RepID=UPI0011EA539C|nr:YraN family protein [Desulforamulus ferrireducens]